MSLGVYIVKQRTILPRSVTQRNISLHIHYNRFCVIRKNNQSTYPDAIKEIKDNFNYESIEISDVILKQVTEYKFPISYEENCMFAVFAFDLETCSVKNQLYCEAYAADVYHPNRLYECFNGDLTEIELEMERKNVHVFDRENGNPVLDMINYVINNYKGKGNIVTNKYVKKMCLHANIRWSVITIVVSIFYIVLNSLPNLYTSYIHTNKNRLEEVNRLRNGYIRQHVTSVDIEEVVGVDGVITELFQGFFDNLVYSPFDKFVLDMTAKRKKYKKEKRKHNTNSS